MTERPTGGGSYLRHPDGTLEQTEAPSRPHPDGDAPRGADGRVIGPDGLPLDPAPAAAPIPDEEA